MIHSDDTALMEVKGFPNALTALIELSFMLDLEYPRMPKTFEFLERQGFQTLLGT